MYFLKYLFRDCYCSLLNIKDFCWLLNIKFIDILNYVRYILLVLGIWGYFGLFLNLEFNLFMKLYFSVDVNYF